MHAFATEICLGRFNDKMVVIVHQAVDVASPVLLLNLPTEESNETLPISVIEGNRLLSIAASRNVIEGAGKFEPEGTSHEARR